MVVLARNDLKDGEVTVGPEHGGCGRTHKYVIGPTGYPQIECPMCENFLRSDSLHSTDIAGVPETFDETRQREALEKRKDRQVGDLTALSMAITSGDKQAEATVRQLMAQQSPVLCVNQHSNPSTAKFCVKCRARLTPAGMVECPDGHLSPADSEFCAECGHDLIAPAQALNGAAHAETPANIPEREEPPPSVPEQPQKPVPPSLPSNTKMRGMKREDLAQLAAEAGLSGEGNRQVLLDRLIAANNGSRGT